MLDGFIGSDLFYLLFGLSYITLAGTVLLYLRDLKRLKERVNVLENKENVSSSWIRRMAQDIDKFKSQKVVDSENLKAQIEKIIRKTPGDSKRMRKNFQCLLDARDPSEKDVANPNTYWVNTSNRMTYRMLNNGLWLNMGQYMEGSEVDFFVMANTTNSLRERTANLKPKRGPGRPKQNK